MELRYHYVRHYVERGLLNIIYCPTATQLADIFTKALPRDRFCTLRTCLVYKGEC
jgi:hypothetical protein